MDDHYESFMDDYNYYMHTGELAEYFEDEYEEEEEVEEVYQQPFQDVYNNQQQQITLDLPLTFTTSKENGNKYYMSKQKIKELKELVEIYNNRPAAKYRVELKSYTFRDMGYRLSFFMEFIAIKGKKIKDYLTINIVLYDKDNDILCKKDKAIIDSDFGGFEVFEFEFYDIKPSEIKRIVIYYQRES
ncbi:MAG: hypothetical protein R3Y50_09260 [Rikenellaceae bacterium]